MRLAAFLLLAGCAQQPLPHRDVWLLDPQGQSVNLSAEDCQPPRIPYYIDSPQGGPPIYLECLREHLND